MVYDDYMIKRYMEKYGCDYDTAAKMFNDETN
jgi:hypothetical protein